MKYLQVKQTDAECTASTEHRIVYYATETDKVWIKKYECPYLCFTAQEDGSTVKLDSVYVYSTTIKITDLNNTITLYVSSDGKDFSLWDGSQITLNNGEKVYIYGDNPTSWYETYYSPHFSMTGTIKASGNIQSLISKDCPENVTYSYLYRGMFYNCTSLTTAPELPATTLGIGCYRQMFRNCTSLTIAPELPATTFNTSSYYQMFYNCTSLTTAPELPATTLANQCYQDMFKNCTSLTKAPELPATTLASSCYRSMFYGCPLTVAPELPATTLANSCYYGMFYNCASLITAPELPATTLVDNCYDEMFRNCTSLNYIKAMFITMPSTIEDTETTDWVDGVASSGTFVKNSAATWTDTFGTSAIPEGWTVEKADA